MQILRYSRLYESAAAYVTDQPAFLNAAVAIQTDLEQEALLRTLKEVEVTVILLDQCCKQETAKPYLQANIWDYEHIGCLQAAAGRDFQGKRWGPRPLDLDIIFYSDTSFNSETLQIPHARWQERDFVKAPISDLYHQEELSSLEWPLVSKLEEVHRLWRQAGGIITQPFLPTFFNRTCTDVHIGD